MTTAASYLAESQIITLSKDFLALADPDEQKGFVTATDLGVFFHEWVHFLHNISTINGLSTFSLQVVLWSNFRWAMNEEGMSIGSGHIAPKDIEGNKNLLGYLHSNKKKNKGSFPAQAKPNELSFNKIKLVNSVVDKGYVVTTSVISCEVEYTGNNYNIDIGVLEIIESVAFMLESKLVRKMNEVPHLADICPYHLVNSLAGTVSPSLNEDIIICCMLASLQSNDPPQLLLQLLKDSDALNESDRYVALSNHVSKNLADQKKIINDQIDQIRCLFPVDEPMARFIKLTLNRIEDNLAYRIKDPFFELSIIDAIYKQPSNIDQFILQFGGCVIIQQVPGDEDQVQRDLMYDMVTPGQDDSVSFGWKMARASFHFLIKHLTLSGEIKSSSGMVFKCPFYSVCNSSVRTSNGKICAESPWKTRYLVGNDDCYYAAAIKATSAPSES